MATAIMKRKFTDVRMNRKKKQKRRKVESQEVVSSADIIDIDQTETDFNRRVTRSGNVRASGRIETLHHLRAIATKTD